MKKKLTLGIASIAILAALSSCSKDSESSDIRNLTLAVYNLYTNPDASANKVSTALAYYAVTTTFPGNTISIAADNMTTPGGGRADFKTFALPFTLKYLQLESTSRQVFSFSNPNPSATNPPITNLSGIITQATYSPATDAKLPDSFNRLIPNSQFYYIVMSYDFAGYNVRTFWPDMTFRGTTFTEYQGMEGTYSTEAMSYRVIMHRAADNSLEDKADIVFYNAKFAAPAPELKAIVLKDLDLTFDLTGYKITGSAVVPQILMDGDNLISNPKFTFDSFTLVCGGDLTNATIYYEVAGMYKGRFSGNSIAK